ncbi:phytoene/squalene synthase family protein [Amorphus orientalis]|uniref:Phytoene synthase n=1 Tax=Amorphus orientalis TaxID=649198 RepID=A0AAE3VPM4_9HYPH|nr:phytoene/squalene synthase family protein [Amorphus orientalis]MDQ0315826.1 phytoene synthase [Amorphus orientalis]
MTDVFDQCQHLVRTKDPDRFSASLFAAAEHRPALMALYAFHFELVRVREVVRDPMPGEIRLQWWRDLLNGGGHGDVRGHPVADALLQTVDRYSLPRAPLIAMTEARVFDLYDDPMPDLGTLEGYAGETHGALFQLSALVLANGSDPGTGTLAGHAGVAEAIASVLRALPHHLRRGQMFLPQEMLERHGTDATRAIFDPVDPGTKAAAWELDEQAWRHLAEVRSLGDSVPAEVAPAFLTLALVPRVLKRVAATDYDPWTSDVMPSRLQSLWTLWRGARRMRSRERNGRVPLGACLAR